LSDGILTYSIDVKDKEKRQVVISAIKEWNRKIEGLQLVEEQNPLTYTLFLVILIKQEISTTISRTE